MKKISALLSLLIIAYSCKKDKDSDSITPFAADSAGVYISNEGKFQAGNASVSYFNPSAGLVYEDVYTQTHHKPLGDICQSLKLINGKIYLVVNNSGKIEVCDAYTMNPVKTITGLTSPRYILQVKNNKAYVSDLYSKNISIINLDNIDVSGTISIAAGTEQMTMKNSLVYITNVSTEYLYIVDGNIDLLSDSIHVSVGGSSIVQDMNGKLWVMCTGDFMTMNAALYKINPVTKTIESTFAFPAGDYPSRLTINPAGDSLYYINGGIFKMSISDNNLPTTAWINPPGSSFYGISIDKKSNIIYATDAIDFSQKGMVYRYTFGGNLIDNFKAGIVPGDFLFLE
jgi:DNA-binding beta-propeller fold protein YncE